MSAETRDRPIARHARPTAAESARPRVAGDFWARDHTTVRHTYAATSDGADANTRVDFAQLCDEVCMRNLARLKLLDWMKERGIPHDLVPGVGSHSIFELAPGGALMLLRTGTLDRENRFFTDIRARDLLLLLDRPGSVVVFAHEREEETLVVPVHVIATHFFRPGTTRNDCWRVHVHCAGRRHRIVQGDLDLTAFAGRHGFASWYRKGRHPQVAKHHHQRLQALIAATGYRLGLQSHVPKSERSRLIAALPGVTLGPMDYLPASVSRVKSVQHADAVLTKSNAPSPHMIAEIEHCGDILAALNRCAHTLATMQAARVSGMPRFIIVADAKRRTEFQTKLLPQALFQRIGLPQWCAFWSTAELQAVHDDVLAGNTTRARNLGLI